LAYVCFIRSRVIWTNIKGMKIRECILALPLGFESFKMPGDSKILVYSPIRR
jgi:hypothetical protein